MQLTFQSEVVFSYIFTVKGPANAQEYNVQTLFWTLAASQLDYSIHSVHVRLFTGFQSRPPVQSGTYTTLEICTVWVNTFL